MSTAHDAQEIQDWHDTQDETYLRLCLQRLQNGPLRWVSQCVELIAADAAVSSSRLPIVINDVGCNVGQFFKGLEEAKLPFPVDYLGLDISMTYLRHASAQFQKAKFELHNIASAPPRRSSDITVCSATLEHVEDWRSALLNMLSSTNRAAYVRTFLGSTFENDLYVKGTSQPYPIQQFRFSDFGEIATDNNFTMKLLRDNATDSIPQYLGCGVTRTQYICCFETVVEVSPVRSTT